MHRVYRAYKMYCAGQIPEKQLCLFCGTTLNHEKILGPNLYFSQNVLKASIFCQNGKVNFPWWEKYSNWEDVEKNTDFPWISRCIELWVYGQIDKKWHYSVVGITTISYKCISYKYNDGALYLTKLYSLNI